MSHNESRETRKYKRIQSVYAGHGQRRGNGRAITSIYSGRCTNDRQRNYMYHHRGIALASSLRHLFANTEPPIFAIAIVELTRRDAIRISRRSLESRSASSYLRSIKIIRRFISYPSKSQSNPSFPFYIIRESYNAGVAVRSSADGGRIQTSRNVPAETLCETFNYTFLQGAL